MGEVEAQRRMLHIYMSVDLLWAWVSAASESPRGDGTENYALKEVSMRRLCSLNRLLQRFVELTFVVFFH